MITYMYLYSFQQVQINTFAKMPWTWIEIISSQKGIAGKSINKRKDLIMDYRQMERSGGVILLCCYLSLGKWEWQHNRHQWQISQQFSFV